MYKNTLFLMCEETILFDDVGLRQTSLQLSPSCGRESDGAAIKDALVRQLYSPVRWVETVLEFGKQGITHNVECAPGKVLVGLNKRIDANQQALSINDGDALKSALSMLV